MKAVPSKHLGESRRRRPYPYKSKNCAFFNDIQRQNKYELYKHRPLFAVKTASEAMSTMTNQSSTERHFLIQGSDAVLYFAVCVINGVFSIITLLGNFVVLGAIWRTPSLHTPSNVFLFGLAVSDFGVGLIAQPSFVIVSVIEFVTETRLGKPWITAFVLTQAVFVFATALTLTMVSVDRFIALTFHLKYKAIITVKRASIILFFIWIASIAYGLAFLLLRARQHHILSAAVFSACMIINLLVYLIIYRIARRHHDQIQAQEQVQVRQENGTLNMSRYRKSVINIFLLSTLFVLCCVPYIFARVYINFADLSRNNRKLAVRLDRKSVV